jgi:hypothetical protein
MITKTTTQARFLYNDASDGLFQYGKESYDNALQQFILPIEDIKLEVFLHPFKILMRNGTHLKGKSF